MNSLHFGHSLGSHIQLYLISDFVQKTELLAQSNTDDDDDDDDDSDDDSDDDKGNYVNELPVS